MRRVALTLRADAVEDVLDILMPLLPQGVYERPLEGGRAEVAFYGDTPAGDELDALAGDALLARDEEEVPEGPEERRRRAGQAGGVAGRGGGGAGGGGARAGGGCPPHGPRGAPPGCWRSSSSRAPPRSAPARTPR